MVLPPVCVARPIGAWKSATAAPDPDEEPPGVRRGSCGFRVLGPAFVAANSAVVVLPRSRLLGAVLAARGRLLYLGSERRRCAVWLHMQRRELEYVPHISGN